MITLHTPYMHSHTHYTMVRCMLNAVRGDATGRLLSHDPKTGRTRELVGGLFFANGVAVGTYFDTHCTPM